MAASQLEEAEEAEGGEALALWRDQARLEQLSQLLYLPAAADAASALAQLTMQANGFARLLAQVREMVEQHSTEDAAADPAGPQRQQSEAVPTPEPHGHVLQRQPLLPRSEGSMAEPSVTARPKPRDLEGPLLAPLVTAAQPFAEPQPGAPPVASGPQSPRGQAHGQPMASSSLGTTRMRFKEETAEAHEEQGAAAVTVLAPPSAGAGQSPTAARPLPAHQLLQRKAAGDDLPAFHHTTAASRRVWLGGPAPAAPLPPAPTASSDRELLHARPDPRPIPRPGPALSAGSFGFDSDEDTPPTHTHSSREQSRAHRTSSARAARAKKLVQMLHGRRCAVPGASAAAVHPHPGEPVLSSACQAASRQGSGCRSFAFCRHPATGHKAQAMCLDGLLGYLRPHGALP
jgi:hypothetical protein